MNYKKYIDSFVEHKSQLLDHGLCESDASVLAAKLMDMSDSLAIDLYRQIKQSEKIRPYRFLATNLTINSIQIKKSTNSEKDYYFKVNLQLHIGVHYKEICLLKKQAYLLLALIILKFRDFETDALGGFEQKDFDHLGFELQDRLGLVEDYLRVSDFDNIKRKLQSSVYDFSPIIETNDLYRLSVPPTLVFFSRNALKSFESISNNSRIEFLQKHHLNYLKDQ
jgi:hypothetical protein